MSEKNKQNDAADAPLSKETHEDLRTVRRTLLRLHKAILDVERTGYELAYGRVESPHALLQLVMHDPWFGWFRPISEMVVRMDELLEAEEPPGTEAQAKELLRDLRSLLNPTEEGEEFGVKYRGVLQDAGVILAHAEISKTL